MTIKANKKSSTARVPIQFNWRANWDCLVKPHLQDPFVQFFLNCGMSLCNRNWKTGDAPYKEGPFDPSARPPAPGTLDWYRPFRRCHPIAFFSLAIGVINYPHLAWRFVSGDMHTVAVGYDNANQPQVVMDILWFGDFSAQESLDAACTVLPRNKVLPNANKQWQYAFSKFETFAKDRASIDWPSTNGRRGSRGSRRLQKTTHPLTGHRCIAPLAAVAGGGHQQSRSL